MYTHFFPFIIWNNIPLLNRTLYVLSLILYYNLYNIYSFIEKEFSYVSFRVDSSNSSSSNKKEQVFEWHKAFNEIDWDHCKLATFCSINVENKLEFNEFELENNVIEE